MKKGARWRPFFLWCANRWRVLTCCMGTLNASKIQLKQALLSTLKDTLLALESAHAASMEGATHEEAKPEDDKDTRGLEQSYLARGQAMRIGGLRKSIVSVTNMNITAANRVREGALVDVEDEHQKHQRFFICPDGGGTKLPEAQVLTSQSPLGALLMGRTNGDEVEFLAAGKSRIYVVKSVT
jgi:transcription elongation GreA/GreB family factor